MQAGGTGRVGGWEGDNVWISACECVSNESFRYHTQVKLIANCMLPVVNNARAVEVVDSRTHGRMAYNKARQSPRIWYSSFYIVYHSPGNIGVDT